MKLPEHQKDCTWDKVKPFGLCNKFPTCVGCSEWKCLLNCPRCAVNEVIDLIKQRRGRLEKQYHETQEVITSGSLMSQIVLLDSILKELEG